MAVTAAPADVRPYTGLVTRAIALVIDALIIQAVALVSGAVVGLLVQVLHVPDTVDTVIKAVGGAVYLVWAASYFVFFWSTTAQTAGAHIMRFRVLSATTGEPLSIPRAIVRFLGLILATIPLFAGFWPVLFTRRRRGLPDWMANTVVVDTDDALL
jgi:uncharacterized RDD family membrane protein YckC